MPNFNEHIKTASLITGIGGFFIDFVKQNQEVEMGLRAHVDAGEAFGKGMICALGGAIGSMIPDKIDIPDNPNHRSHAHSFGSLILSGYILARDSLSENESGNLFLKSIVSGNGIHLLQDSQTSKGLNFL
jgi:hypothetical protein